MALGGRVAGLTLACSPARWAGPPAFLQPPFPPRFRGPGGKAAAPGLARVRVSRGTSLPALLPAAGTSSTCCACPETSLPTAPPHPTGVARRPRRSPRPWLPPTVTLCLLESALFLRLCVRTWFAGGALSRPRLGPLLSSASGGGPRGCCAPHPCRSSHREEGRTLAEGGLLGAASTSPASSWAALWSLGCGELWGPPHVGTGRGGGNSWPGWPRVTGREDRAWGRCCSPTQCRGRDGCPLAALAELALRSTLAVGRPCAGGTPAGWGAPGRALGGTGQAELGWGWGVPLGWVSCCGEERVKG